MLVFCVGVSGCFRHVYSQGNGGTVEKYDQWQHHFVVGLVNTPTVDVDSVCPNTKDFTVYERQTFLNGLVSGLTLGIYTPSKITVSCGNS